MTIIALSREKWALGTSVGKEVARRLGYEFIHHDVVSEAAREYDFLEEELVRTLQTKPGFMELFRQTALQHRAVIVSEVYEVACRDNVVILGRWATFLLREVKHGLRVRLCADKTLRVRRMMEHHDLDHETALHKVERFDEGVRARVKRFFDVEWGDPLNYDLTLNTERLSIDAAVRQIVILAQHPEFTTTAESQQAVENLALSAKVNAALLTNTASKHILISISADCGVVTLTGTVLSEEDKKLAEEIARTVEGVTAVTNELVIVRTTYR